MSSDQPYIIGVTGRSGSGKTTLVKKLQEKYGDKYICVHTMDNYYKPSHDQEVDEEGYKNFDLPSSFEQDKFIEDLKSLKDNRSIEVPLYDYTVEGCIGFKLISSAPIIIVEGLFIYHYEAIRKDIDLKVIVDLSLDEAFKRRLKRDVEERDYAEEVTQYRYANHVEPAYQAYIAPYLTYMDKYIDNKTSLDAGFNDLSSIIEQKLELSL